MLMCFFVSPQHIVIDSVPTSSRAPLDISIISLVLSILSFVFAWKQFRSDRKSAWFHKVAVDPLLRGIFDFFEGAKAELVDCAIKYQNHVNGHRKTVPANITKPLTLFSVQCSDLYEEVAARVEVFYPKGATDFRALAEKHHDSIARSVFRGKDEVVLSVDVAKRELLTKLRECDR